jgi:hypothetical protein
MSRHTKTFLSRNTKFHSQKFTIKYSKKKEKQGGYITAKNTWVQKTDNDEWEAYRITSSSSNQPPHMLEKKEEKRKHFLDCAPKTPHYPPPKKTRKCKRKDASR